MNSHTIFHFSRFLTTTFLVPPPQKCLYKIPRLSQHPHVIHHSQVLFSTTYLVPPHPNIRALGKNRNVNCCLRQNREQNVNLCFCVFDIPLIAAQKVGGLKKRGKQFSESKDFIEMLGSGHYLKCCFWRAWLPDLIGLLIAICLKWRCNQVFTKDYMRV